MKKTIPIPDGVSLELKGDTLIVKGPNGSLERAFPQELLTIQVNDSVVVESKNERRRSLAHTGTTTSHIQNMIHGVTSGYEAHLKVIYSHFPMKLKVEGNRLLIQNFMGERATREIEILEGVNVKTSKEDVIVSGPSKEAVGQTAGRIEQKTRVRGFDKRVFQDGIHLTQKTHVKEEAS